MQLITQAEVRAIKCPDALSDGASRAGPCDVRFAEYLVLTECADRFLQAGWRAETVFWSRYYWFRRAAAAQDADAGLAQQAFQLLEHPFPLCSPDWSLLPEVERQAVAA